MPSTRTQLENVVAALKVAVTEAEAALAAHNRGERSETWKLVTSCEAVVSDVAERLDTLDETR